MSDGDGPDMWDMMEMYEALQDGEMTAEQQEKLLDALDEEQVKEAVRQAVTQMVVPHLEEVRQQAQHRKNTGEDRQSVRQQLESLSERDQTDEFNQAVAECVTIAAELHNDPERAATMAKNRVRNPWTMERLLLPLSRAHDDPGHADEMKELVTDSLRWFSIYLVPEAYTYEEKRELLAKLFPDRDPDAMLGGADAHGHQHGQPG